MTTLDIVLIVISAVLFLLLLLVLCFRLRQNREIDSLSESIDRFLQDGKETGFSIKDNKLARLQNAICDLENKIELENNNTKNQTKKNIEFISDVSHQLKTPLAGLRLYCEMEHAENPNDHTEKELVLIEKMEKLVFNLLKLEKIKSDAFTMNYSTCEMSKVIGSVVSDFQGLFPEKNYIVSGESELRCDKEWISEAISNIIKNASEHTAHDGTVKADITDTSKSTIIEISDNGGGIDEKELGNLFTRFFKAKNSSPSGAGIGLAISKAIVEKHHGIISAENKSGGFCVTICIPHIDGIRTV